MIYEELTKLSTGQKPILLNQKDIHITVDNFFSGDQAVKYAIDNQFGLTTSTRRDRLPSGVPGKYLHKEKTNSTARPKAARFLQPIFCVKKFRDSENNLSGMIQLTSFQSTSSCNITCVNALNSCSLFATTKERGQSHHTKENGQ